MSKLTEWMRLIPEGMKEPLAVIEGVVNSVKMEYGGMEEPAREEIVKRRLICSTCPFNSVLAKTSSEYKEVVGVNYSSDRDDLHCSFCGCPIDTRTAALTKPCGISSWNKNHPEKPLTLKWDKYGNSKEH